MSRRLAVIMMLVVAFAGGGWWYAQRPQSTTDADPPERKKQTNVEIFQAGMNAVRAGEMTEAADSWELLAQHPSHRQHAAVLRAAILLKQDDPSGALQVLRGVSPEGDLWRPAGLVMTEVLYRLQDLAGAERIVSAIVLKHPKSVVARRWLASIYYDLGANNAAMEQLIVLSKLVPDDFTPHHLLGQMYFDSEKYTQAIDHFQQALSLKPPPTQRRSISRILARSLLKTNQFEKALKVAAEYETDTSMLAMAGTAEWGLGHADTARELLRKAEKIESENRDVLVLKARMALESGDVETAIKLLRSRLSKDPHDFECRYRLALCYRKQKKLDLYKKEIAAMQKVQGRKVELNRLTELAIQRPRDADIRDRIATLYGEIGKPKLAAVYKRAAEACRRAQRRK